MSEEKMFLFGEVKRCACGRGYMAQLSGDGWEAQAEGDTHATAIGNALLAALYQRSIS